MTRSFYKDTVVRIRAGIAPNPHSSSGSGLDWSAPARLVINGCRVQVLSSAERETRPEITHRLLLPISADIEADDRVEFVDARGRTRTSHVDGEPTWGRGPTGAAQHAEARLRAMD